MMDKIKSQSCYLIILVNSFILSGCFEANKESESVKTEVSQSGPNQTTTQIARNESKQYEPPKIKWAALPSEVDLNPCRLLTDADLKAFGLPKDQHLSQRAFTQQLPNSSKITPKVGCKWRSVNEAVPLAWIYIQQIRGELKNLPKKISGFGEYAFKMTAQGRDHLVIKTDERLVMIASQIPYTQRSDMENNALIAEKVLDRLQEVTKATKLATANASLVGGPNLDICATAMEVKPYELLQGLEAYSFPNYSINHVPSTSKRPDPDGVSCTFASERRGGVYVHYLGADGVRKWNQHFEKNGEKIQFGGRPAFRDRKLLYVPLEKGGITVETRGIRYAKDEDIDAKVGALAQAILKKL